MQVHALLENRRSEVVAEIEKLQAELAEIDRAMSVLRSSAAMPATGVGVKAATSQPHGQDMPATKDEAIMRAIGAGARTPATISDFIRNQLGMPVNDASTRTRLSRMKAAEKIDHDGIGWKLKD